MIVFVFIIKDILDGKIFEIFEDLKNIKMIEVSWGEELYIKGYIFISVYVNIDIIEFFLIWMFDNDDNLIKFVLDYGLIKDDIVIVLSSIFMVFYRLVVILRYIGVKDVRVLNGGINLWLLVGYELEFISNLKYLCINFGVDILVNL